MGECPRCEEQTEPVRIDDTLTRMECGNPGCEPPGWRSQVVAWLPVGFLVGLAVAIAIFVFVIFVFVILPEVQAVESGVWLGQFSDHLQTIP